MEIDPWFCLFFHPIDPYLMFVYPSMNIAVIHPYVNTGPSYFYMYSNKTGKSCVVAVLYDLIYNFGKIFYILTKIYVLWVHVPVRCPSLRRF